MRRRRFGKWNHDRTNRLKAVNHPDLCLYEVTDGVAVLTFNRPDSMNGMTGNMEVAYYQRLAQAESDRDVRVIVVTGAGRAWCPGADLSYRPGPDDEPLPNRSISTTTPLGVGKPMIAAINGACAGMALALALQCDFRFAAAGAKFTTAFASRGLIAEYGLAWLLSSVANRAVALDLLLTARVIESEEMASLGLVNRVTAADDVLAEAIEFARLMTRSVSPASMAAVKHQILTEPSMSLADAMASSDALMLESLVGADVQEGVGSFLEKRETNFAPLGEGTIFGWMGS